MPKVAIVILNWNGESFLAKFLPSVVANSAGAEVVVIDNASTDNSLGFLQKKYPDIEIIVLDKNYGFAEGYNRGLEKIKAAYYILLNSDVEVTESWWQPLIELLESDKTIAAVQPKICSFNDKTRFEYAGACGGYLDSYGYPFCRGRILDSLEVDNGQYDGLQKIFWASGAAMAIRADLFHEMSGFDAAFFAHMEEIDLCWRIQNRGYSIFCEPKSIVYHVGGGTLPNESPFKLYLNFRNNLWMLYKNLPKEGFFFVFLVRMFLDGIAAVKYLISGKIKNAQSVLKAHIAFYSNLKRLYKQRKMLNQKRRTTAQLYDKSILWEYFWKGKKQFSSLERKGNRKNI